MSLEGISNSAQPFTRKELLIFSSIANTKSGYERNSAIKSLTSEERLGLCRWRKERRPHISQDEKKLPFWRDVSDLKVQEEKYKKRFLKK